jgi:hypothetical protein
VSISRDVYIRLLCTLPGMLGLTFFFIFKATLSGSYLLSLYLRILHPSAKEIRNGKNKMHFTLSTSICFFVNSYNDSFNITWNIYVHLKIDKVMEKHANYFNIA